MEPQATGPGVVPAPDLTAARSGHAERCASSTGSTTQSPSPVLAGRGLGGASRSRGLQLTSASRVSASRPPDPRLGRVRRRSTPSHRPPSHPPADLRGSIEAKLQSLRTNRQRTPDRPLDQPQPIVAEGDRHLRRRPEVRAKQAAREPRGPPNSSSARSDLGRRGARHDHRRTPNGVSLLRRPDPVLSPARSSGTPWGPAWRPPGPVAARESSITRDKFAAAAAAMRERKRPMHASATALGVSRATLCQACGYEAH